MLVKAADVGEVLAPGTTVVDGGATSTTLLPRYVNETDLGKTQAGGASRKVTTDVVSRARSTRGRRDVISSEAEFTPKADPDGAGSGEV